MINTQQERNYDVILGQYVTEKSAAASEKHGQYTFMIARDATKTEVKSALKSIYNVDVDACRIVNRPGKTKVRRGGKTKPFKLAYVSLKGDQSIELTG